MLIQNAYFLPDRGLRRALARAVARGVDVRVIVPGRSDVRLIEWASLYVLRRLAQRGVKILRWRGVMMHAKTAIVDAMWSTIGSYNFDSQSRFNNLEVTVEILDPAIGAALRRRLRARRRRTATRTTRTAGASCRGGRRRSRGCRYRLRRFL